MAIHVRHPIIPLVVGALLVSIVGAGIFGVWAVFDVIPSTLDNSFVSVQCIVASSEVISNESCPCADDGLTCADTYPCMRITVNLTSVQEKSAKTRFVQLYKNMRGRTFTTKCSYYPLGKGCTGKTSKTILEASKFRRSIGRPGKNMTCYIDNNKTPTVVVAERSVKDVPKLILFVVSVILFFLPTLALNIFFLYKWQFLAYLSSTLTRHNRVGVTPSVDLDQVERRSSSYRLKTLQFAERSSTIPEEKSNVIPEEKTST